MLYLRTLATLVALAAGATVLHAQNLDAIKQRREAMATIARSGTPAFKMFKGDMPFELPKVQAGLKAYQEQAVKFKALFPADSKTGGETDASPSIWTDRPAFDNEVDKFVVTAKAAAEAIKDETTFKAEYQKVLQSCGGCHKDKDGFSPRLADSLKKLSQ